MNFKYFLLAALVSHVSADTPPACMLACVAKSTKSSSDQLTLNEQSSICSKVGSEVIKCLESSCPNNSADTAKTYFKSLCGSNLKIADTKSSSSSSTSTKTTTSSSSSATKSGSSSSSASGSATKSSSGHSSSSKSSSESSKTTASTGSSTTSVAGTSSLSSAVSQESSSISASLQHNGGSTVKAELSLVLGLAAAFLY